MRWHGKERQMEGPRRLSELDVGVDIAAATFTAAWLVPGSKPSAPVTLAQDAAGYATVRQRLQATGVAPEATRVVMEATSTYWIALAVALHEAGYRVSVINPAQAHYFAKAQLRRAKTDALDAQDLARLAGKLELTPWSPPPAVYHELRQRLLAREALLALRQQAANQRHALMQWPVVVASAQRQFDEVITDLDERSAAVEQELRLVLADGAWAESAAMLTSAPGIGVLTAAWLLVATVNFTLAPGPEALAAYAGLAPMPRQSGTSVHGRPSIGHAGNGHLRRALYMATLSAARYNPAIKPFYDRLRAAGKPAKVARCAAARKLLHLSWALVTKRQKFDPEHRQPQHPETALAS
jgi:transposase